MGKIFYKSAIVLMAACLVLFCVSSMASAKAQEKIQDKNKAAQHAILNELIQEIKAYEEQIRDFRKEIQLLIEKKYNRKRKRIRNKYAKHIQELEAEERARRDEAVKKFEEFVSRYPNHKIYTPHALYRLAELHFEKSKEDYFEAEETYQKDLEKFDKGLIKKEPAPPRQHFERTIALEQKIVSRFPEYPLVDGAYYLLAYCLDQQGELTQAAETFRELIEKSPDSKFITEAWIRIGEFNFDEAELTKALHAYSQAMKNEQHPLYDKVLYKMAWTYYRMAGPDTQEYFQKSVDYFTKLVDFYEKKGKDASADMKEEALQYIAVCYAEEGWGGIDNLNKYYHSLGGRTYEVDIYRRLSKAFFEQTRYDEAIKGYKIILDKEPLAEDAPELQVKIIKAFQQLRNFVRVAEEEERLVATYSPGTKWYKANLTKAEVMKKAEELTKRSLLSASGFHHRQAQKLTEEGRFSEAVEEYKIAANSYSEYLKRYPFAKNIYDLTYLYADALYFSFQYEMAAEQYVLVRDTKTNQKYLQDSTFGAFDSYRMLVEQLIREGKLEIKEKPVPDPADVTPKEIIPVEPEEIPEDFLKLVSAGDMLLKMTPDHEQASKIIYQTAERYYSYRHFNEARTRFLDIIKRFPREQLANWSANLIVNSYLIENDYDNIAKIASHFLESGLSAHDSVFVEGLKINRVGALFKKATLLFNKKEYDEASNLYIELVDRFPTNRFADKALFNAAQAYMKVNRFNSAMKTYERIPNEYPQSELADESLFYVANAADKNFEYEKAVNSYLRLVDQYTNSKNRANAMYNAALILEYLQDYSRAASNFQRYAIMFPEQKDAADMFYRSALVMEKKKDYRGMIKSLQRFIRRYGAEKEQADRVVEAYLKIADVYEKQKNRKLADKFYTKTIDEFYRRGKTPKDHSAYFAAKAKFILMDRQFEPYARVKFTGRPKKDKKLLEKKAELNKSLKDVYKEVFPFKIVEWTLASFYRLGYVDEEFSRALFDAPVPKGFSMEEADMYRMQLEDFAMPIEERAVAAYQKVIQESEKFKVSNDWVEKAKENLNRYRPVEFPLKKKPKYVFEEKRFSGKGLVYYLKKGEKVEEIKVKGIDKEKLPEVETPPAAPSTEEGTGEETAPPAPAENTEELGEQPPAEGEQQSEAEETANQEEDSSQEDGKTESSEEVNSEEEAVQKETEETTSEEEGESEAPSENEGETEESSSDEESGEEESTE